MKESNKKKSCLIIADSFPPVASAGAKRISILSKYLKRLGWKVYVLTTKEGYRNYIEGNRCFIPENVKVIRTKAFYPVIENIESRNICIMVKKAIRRFFHLYGFPDFLMGWIPFCVAYGCNIIKEEDIRIIYSSSPRVSSHIIALFIKKIAHKPWIAEFRDPITAHPSSFNNPLQRLFGKKIGKEILRKCDGVISVNEMLDQQFKDIYPHNYGKFYIIHNGFDPELHSRQVSEYKNNRIFNISYTGAFYPSRGRVPDFFLKAVSNLIKHGSIDPERIKIRFFSSFPKQSYKILESEPISQIVSVNKYVELKQSLQIQQESDLLLLFTGYNKGNEWETTSKIFEYMGARKTVLALTCEGSHVSKIIEETKIGKAVIGNQIEEIKRTLLEYYNEFYKNGGYLEYSPMDSVVNEYNYSKLTEKLNDIFISTIEKYQRI